MTKLSHRVFALLVKALAWSVVLFILAQYYSCNNSGITPPDGSDTTSHNFSWRVDTLGDGNASVLNDVAIINDTLAYAVGEIYLKDSTGQYDANGYNLVKWDGKKWNLKRIPFIGTCSAVTYPPLRAVWAFSENNILVTNGGSIVTYDGVNATMDCRMNSLLAGAINKLFATNISDVYAVGNGGSIVWYNGSGWQKLSSGTTVNIQDIWGASFDVRGIHLQTILAVASNRSAVPQGRNVLSIQGTRVALIDDNGLAMDLSAVWFIPGWKYFLTGSGVYISPDGTNWRRDTSQPSFYANAIRGQAANDIMIAGSYGVISHYNGSRWTHYLGGQLQQFFGEYKAVAIKGNLVIAVGWKEDKAIVLTGRR
jgi:hypothetical protein